MWSVIAIIGAVALLVYAVWRVTDHFPPRYRRYGGGEIQQMLDHVHGRFGGSYPQDTERAQPIRKIKRNDPCGCGSGLKYKRCCGKS